MYSGNKLTRNSSCATATVAALCVLQPWLRPQKSTVLYSKKREKIQPSIHCFPLSSQRAVLVTMSVESGVSYQKNGGNGAAPNGNGGKISVLD
jgi:hypothetical protein